MKRKDCLQSDTTNLSNKLLRKKCQIQNQAEFFHQNNLNYLKTLCLFKQYEFVVITTIECAGASQVNRCDGVCEVPAEVTSVALLGTAMPLPLDENRRMDQIIWKFQNLKKTLVLIIIGGGGRGEVFELIVFSFYFITTLRENYSFEKYDCFQSDTTNLTNKLIGKKFQIRVGDFLIVLILINN